MFAPIFPLAVKGAIWYQGCANICGEKLYFKLFNAMVDDWRTNLTGGDFPVYLVQLAAYRQTNEAPHDSAWARMRWVMTQLGETVKNCGTAIAIDVGDHIDLHPKDKKTVGERLARLARLALNRTYGRKHIVEAGPIPTGVARSEQGIVVSFKNAVGLKTSDAAEVSGFQVVDGDGKAVWAKAKIAGETVVVSVPESTAVSAVRFAWDDYPVCNLVNAESLPCGPFAYDVK
jgi:sialate O-acetylesterase